MKSFVPPALERLEGLNRLSFPVRTFALVCRLRKRAQNLHSKSRLRNSQIFCQLSEVNIVIYRRITDSHNHNYKYFAIASTCYFRNLAFKEYLLCFQLLRDIHIHGAEALEYGFQMMELLTFSHIIGFQHVLIKRIGRKLCTNI